MKNFYKNNKQDIPSLAIEIDYTQSDAAQRLFKHNRFDDIVVIHDLNKSATRSRG